ncbi:MAG TPA: hypothetical protein P5279_17240 [Anaerohalosphaeraceae bacterium]|jgi:hypothetical protein|nr:hypothetical protein [Anaerohalosphaeraceae bacterium]HRT52237.1 hypothetical protein [Anaerohalosphaeraceae bacterium]HRT88260.1 hypothetical protein [Anaerohalosphaeraceae bacterium]
MKQLSVLILLGCLALPVCAAQSTRSPAVPLRDGTFYNGIEGTAFVDPNSHKWYFRADIDVTDGLATVPAQTPVEMLPCSTLERIINAVGTNTAIDGKLWARVTRYSNRNILIDKLPSRKFANRRAVNKDTLDSAFLSKHLTNENYLLAIDFIPMKTAETPAPVDNARPDAAKPQHESIIPADILEKLERKRVVDLNTMKEMLATEGDVVLTDRVGFVHISDGTKIFTVDGLGRNVENLEFSLLPCEALEYTEKALVDMPSVRQRFRVSGIVTTFRGNTYMLLQRATRTYSHGNFAR